ncbi:hypothetical protein BP6252_13316 [Coleophoma cylindrospora]|uniref:Uncharacterized protein n=1 Tax=Coleophoma cylindrospora TaxID=1849047 RepID=A0A3D8QB09_9HELO|nr:hypothetical protein BP6252_13316 [Coleophoma cylindrospora]
MPMFPPAVQAAPLQSQDQKAIPQQSVGTKRASRIHITGASGSGVSTLGTNLASALSVPVFDVDNYYWIPTNPPYTTKRPIPERISLLRPSLAHAQEENGGWVLSGSIGTWGEEFMEDIEHVIFVDTTTEVRMKRLREREFMNHGERIQEGGDMYEESIKFLAWAEAYEDPGLEEGRSTSYEVVGGPGGVSGNGGGLESVEKGLRKGKGKERESTTVHWIIHQIDFTPIASVTVAIPKSSFTARNTADSSLAYRECVCTVTSESTAPTVCDVVRKVGFTSICRDTITIAETQVAGSDAAYTLFTGTVEYVGLAAICRVAIAVREACVAGVLTDASYTDIVCVGNWSTHVSASTAVERLAFHYSDAIYSLSQGTRRNFTYVTVTVDATSAGSVMVEAGKVTVVGSQTAILVEVAVNVDAGSVTVDAGNVIVEAGKVTVETGVVGKSDGEVAGLVELVEVVEIFVARHEQALE